MSKATKSDKTRQLSIEQANAIEHLLQGQSDRAVADVVGVSRQTVSEWKNHDPLFIAELNRQRFEMWREARERMKSLANRALDVVELQLGSSEPKAAMTAAKYVLQALSSWVIQICMWAVRRLLRKCSCQNCDVKPGMSGRQRMVSTTINRWITCSILLYVRTIDAILRSRPWPIAN